MSLSVRRPISFLGFVLAMCCPTQRAEAISCLPCGCSFENLTGVIPRSNLPFTAVAVVISDAIATRARRHPSSAHRSRRKSLSCRYAWSAPAGMHYRRVFSAYAPTDDQRTAGIRRQLVWVHCIRTTACGLPTVALDAFPACAEPARMQMSVGGANYLRRLESVSL
ncbi:hypothetical protein BC628DRAFT_1105446 [Trametes gibbosa]|nr:hypothetical protein BC628DRAFT_1105446 [Trametes gibbosa]